MCYSDWFIFFLCGVGIVEVKLREVVGLMKGGVFKIVVGLVLVGI